MKGYLAQYARAGRCLRNALTPGPDKTAKEDDFVTFFMHCWHIKDHVDKDLSLPADVRQRILLAAHRTPALKVCQQIANGMKHFTAYPADMKGHNDLTVFVGTGTSVVYPLITFDDGTQERAADVAVQAFASWTKLFEAESLTVLAQKEPISPAGSV